MNWLGNFRILTKIAFIIVVSMLALLLTQVISMTVLHGQMMDDRKAKTQDVVRLGLSLVDYYYQQSRLGVLDETEARRQALAAIKTIRYQGGNYIWINDMQPRMVMHPMKPELDGKDLSGSKDKRGKFLFNEMVRVVGEQAGGGFVDYYWQKPGAGKNDEAVAKLSFVQQFEPWGWVLGTGIYIDDVDAVLWSNGIKNLSIALVLGLALLVFSVLLGNSVRASIDNFREVLRDIHENGNLQRRVDILGRDEIGDIAVIVNDLLGSFQTALQEVRSGTDSLNSISGELSRVADNTRRQIESQRADSDAAERSVIALSESSEGIAEHAASAASSTHTADEQSKNGYRVVIETKTAIDRLANEINQAAEAIRSLAQDSEQIGSVVEVINGIADQTNLLALNAAIEAARAGDQGRGFAVVADEVRTLAQRTQDSTEEIRRMVEKLQGGARNAVAAMEAGQLQAKSCVNTSGEAETALNEIAKDIANISGMANQIASASQEQHQVSDDIRSGIGNLNRVMGENAQAMVDVTRCSSAVRDLSDSLNGIVGRYRL